METYPDLPKHFLQNMIEKSVIHKSRLLHYFPIAAEPTSTGDIDSWCGIHIDHCVLTGLVSAMYVDESTDDYSEIDKSNLDVQNALQEAGLYIKNRSNGFTRVFSN
jgi:hypothetical protein